MEKIRVIYLVLLILLPIVLKTQTNNVIIPVGRASVIDGITEESEWSDAACLDFSGGEFVKLKVSENALLIALKGKSGGICSLALGNSEKVRILHASSGLITADYTISEDGKWYCSDGFEEPMTNELIPFKRGNVRHGEDYRIANIDQFGWYSNLVEMNDPSEYEFMIRLDNIKTEELYLSIVFFQVKARTRLAKLPVSLNDDCLNQPLIAGTAASGLDFKPKSWVKLKIEK